MSGEIAVPVASPRILCGSVLSYEGNLVCYVQQGFGVMRRREGRFKRSLYSSPSLTSDQEARLYPMWYRRFTWQFKVREAVLT